MYLAVLYLPSFYHIVVISFCHKSTSRDGSCKLASTVNTMTFALDSCSQFVYVHCICPYQINHESVNIKNNILRSCGGFSGILTCVFETDDPSLTISRSKNRPSLTMTPIWGWQMKNHQVNKFIPQDYMHKHTFITTFTACFSCHDG